MPSSVTHNYFSSDVYDKLNTNTKKRISPCFDEYKVFSQGPDPYFFYDFHLTKRSKYAYKINKSMQHTFVNKHFVSLINYICENNYYSNSMVLSYLYGQICHYVLDSTCHPYIIYNTGMYNPNNSGTYKYNGLHEGMEYYIDCYMIYMREKIMPKRFKAYKNLFKKISFNIELKNLIDNVSFEVYGFKDVSSIYLKSIKDMKKFYHIFNYDRLGIKKAVYIIMDKICGNKIVKKRELSFHIDPLSKLFYLNSEKNFWCNPCDNNDRYNYSFFELYEIAINKAVIIINTIDKMLQNQKVDNNLIEKILGNFDYGTGKNCDLNLEYKFFKF